VRDLSCGDRRIYLELDLRRVAYRRCGTVKQERLAWLADSPFYTRRFAFFVGRRCRAATIQDVARETHLNWKTVKTLEMQYMREQLRRAGAPRPRIIGLDELSIRKGHSYRIIVSDLERQRPIWFGGWDRSELSLDSFFKWLGPRKRARIELAVMDMWPAFQNSTRRHAPAAKILFDKFHVLRHLGDALDRCGSGSITASPGGIAASSRGRSTRSSRTEKASHWRAAKASNCSWQRTSAYFGQADRAFRAKPISRFAPS